MRIRVNDIVLNYIKVGNGKPLILLHGNGESHHIFDKLVEKLKHDFTIYAVDSRNHGESSTSENIDYRIMAQDILDFINEMNLTQPCILGFSDGGIIALLLALKNPDLFEKMALLGINLQPTDFIKEFYDEMVEEYSKTKDPLIKIMLEEPNIKLTNLQTIHTPTFIIGGENDMFPIHLFENIATALPHSQLLIMKGHTHDSYIIHQDILYPYLKDFFATL